MDNSSEVIFVLQGLNETWTNKQIYFVFTLLVYLFTIFANLALIVTIITEKMLREPMFIFLCSLCVNGLLGASSFYPKFLTDLLSDVHIISYNACMVQLFISYTYIFCEFTTLTVMAYDRYVAICKPLKYHSIITPRKVVQLLLLSWLFPLSESVAGIILTVRLPICGFLIEKPYCTNWAVVKLSCGDTTLNNAFGYILTLSHVLQSVLILLSYVNIVKVSIRSPADRSKFMQTCLPHLITMINFTVALVFDVMYARYGSSRRLQPLQNFLALEFMIVPPVLNPVIYGLKLNQIRTRILRMLKWMVTASA